MSFWKPFISLNQSSKKFYGTFRKLNPQHGLWPQSFWGNVWIHPEEMDTTLRIPSCGKLRCQVTQSSVCQDRPYHFGHSLQFVGRRPVYKTMCSFTGSLWKKREDSNWKKTHCPDWRWKQNTWEEGKKKRTDAWAGSILDSSVALLFTTLISDLKTYSLQNPKTWSDNLLSRQTSSNCTESVLNNGGA